MVFSSLLFLFRFLPMVLLLYFIVPRKLKNAVLFFSSLLFYAWGEPIYFIIMLFSTLTDFTHGKLVYYFKEKGEDIKAKYAVVSAMIINLTLLGFFKYSDFLIDNINNLFNSNLAQLNLALPIGISFYTFQTMSYTIDVYRGEAKVQNNIISFGAYVALFPQLIAGPIVQYKTIAKQLQNRKESVDQFSYGVMRFMIGLGKKVLLANNIGIVWSNIEKLPIADLPILTAWLGIVAFAFQIYFDFSGYSDMAIGLGSMFGFKFLENFNYPYEASSITEFWRRWHISLSSWFRDYVYIPLGGNRKGFIKQIRNIIIVWLLTGIWHGASWNFVVWGLYFGFILIIEKLFLLKKLEKTPGWIGNIYTLFIVLIGWVIFAFDDFSKGFLYLKAMFGIDKIKLYDSNTLYLLYTNIIIIVILVIASTSLPKAFVCKYMNILYDKGQTNKLAYSWYMIIKNGYIIGIFIVSVAYLVDASYNPFLYFRF